jgi:uncharacterized membrane protein YphA (DoxX/SURF4 family)
MTGSKWPTKRRISAPFSRSHRRMDAAVLFCFVFFYIFFAGGGVWSLDRAALKQD